MEYEIIEKNDWVISEGCYNSRVVLLKLKGVKEGEYTTHIEIEYSKNNRGLVLGHYYVSLQDALNDYLTRSV